MLKDHIYIYVCILLPILPRPLDIFAHAYALLTSYAADRFVFDAMHAVTGAYAKPIFVDKLGASLVCMPWSFFFNYWTILRVLGCSFIIYVCCIGVYCKWSATGRFWTWSSRP